MIIGGGMAYTFLKVLKDMPIGSSLYDEEGAKIVPEIMEKAKAKGVEITLPVDFKCSSKFGEDGEMADATEEKGVPEGMMGLDCGPKSIELNNAVIMSSKTIIWNGPMVSSTAAQQHRRCHSKRLPLPPHLCCPTCLCLCCRHASTRNGLTP